MGHSWEGKGAADRFWVARDPQYSVQGSSDWCVCVCVWCMWTAESKPASGDISISLDSASRGENETEGKLSETYSVSQEKRESDGGFLMKETVHFLFLHFSPSNQVNTGEVLQDESIKFNYFYSFD